MSTQGQLWGPSQMSGSIPRPGVWAGPGVGQSTPSTLQTRRPSEAKQNQMNGDKSSSWRDSRKLLWALGSLALVPVRSQGTQQLQVNQGTSWSQVESCWSYSKEHLLGCSHVWDARLQLPLGTGRVLLSREALCRHAQQGDSGHRVEGALAPDTQTWVLGSLS